MSHDPLLTLREQVRRIEKPMAAAHGVVPFGVATIDRALPGGGLARGALHEIIGAGGDEEDGTLAAALAAGVVAKLAAAEDGIVLWCLTRPDLYGPGLAACGLDPARLVQVQAARDSEILWAMEEGLRSSGVIAVIGEIGTCSDVASRRLQLAAERSGITAFVLRRWRNAGQAAHERNLPNAAATRWRIAALPSHPISLPFYPPNSIIRHPSTSGHPGAASAAFVPLNPRFRAGDGHNGEEPGVGHPRWRVELLRCRGSEPACWIVEVREGKMADATDFVSLASSMADRPSPPVGRVILPRPKISRTG